MFVGQRLKALRKEKNLSQQALGDALGITKVSICGYENGTRIPSLETFVMLADFFGVTTDYFLGREVSVIHEGEGEYVGSISQDDIKIQKELRKHTELYNQLIQDPKRTVSLINKKMQIFYRRI